MIAKLIKQWRCEHPMFDQDIEQTALGVTLGWCLTPCVEYEWTKTCRLCGKVRKSRGYLPRRVDDTPRDDNGWPLNPDGSKMKIAEGGR